MQGTKSQKEYNPIEWIPVEGVHVDWVGFKLRASPINTDLVYGLGLNIKKSRIFHCAEPYCGKKYRPGMFPTNAGTYHNTYLG